MAPADNNDLLNLVTKKLAYISQRQGVLAENIANANTPGFKPKDLAPFTFDTALRQASSGDLKVTDPRHIGLTSISGVNSKSSVIKGAEKLPSGNEVDLEQQAMSVSQNAIDFQGMVGVYKKVTTWFRLALGKSA